MLLIHKSEEGEKQYVGLNYWFVKDNPTRVRIILIFPIGFRPAKVTDFYKSGTERGILYWEIFVFKIYFRIRNLKRFKKGTEKYIFKFRWGWI